MEVRQVTANIPINEVTQTRTDRSIASVQVIKLLE
jgi:hypothetical protein